MIEDYRIIAAPAGYLVQGYFDLTFKRNWFERLIGVPRGLYGWHNLDLTGHKYTFGVHAMGPAIFPSCEKAKHFIEWQKNVGKVVSC